MAQDKNKQPLAAGDFVTHDGKRCKVLAANQQGGPGIINLVLEVDDESKHTFAVSSSEVVKATEGEPIKESGGAPTHSRKHSREQSA